MGGMVFKRIASTADIRVIGGSSQLGWKRMYGLEPKMEAPKEGHTKFYICLDGTGFFHSLTCIVYILK